MIRSNPDGPGQLPGATHGGLVVGASENAPDAGGSPLAMIDDRLRGRWRLAIGVGAVLGVFMGAAGFTLAPVTFRSTGTIHVRASGSAILHESAETSLMPRFDGIVKTQAILVQDPHLIEMALENEALKALPLYHRPDAVQRISAHLSASAVPQTELVSVSYESVVASEAQIVLNAVLETYELRYGGERSDFQRKRRTTLEGQAAGLKAQREAKQRELNTFLIDQSEYGGDNLERVLEMKLVRIEELRQDSERLSLALQMLRGPEDADTGEVAPVIDPTEDDLVRFDPEYAALLRSVKDQRVALARLETRYRPTHLIVRGARQALDTAEAQLAGRHEDAVRQWMMSAGGLAPVPGRGDMTPEEVERQIGHIAQHIDSNRDEVRTLNTEQVRISGLQAELGDYDEQLGEIRSALHILDIESQAELSGEIEIQSLGMLPRQPDRDRRVPMAAVGFLGGFGVSMAFFFLMGTVDRRAFSASQLRQELTGLRCLGVLPDLGSGGAGREMNETAAQCVHQIRNRIEAPRRGQSSLVLVVSSPFQGDGKTSLTMALGWSYAAAGYRTLLVDADLYGEGLSDQLSVADRPGLREVLRERHLGEQITAMAVPNLFVLGCGLDASFGPESIRRDDFDTLAGELRREYDVVIVDTGPALGSVELFPVASASDGVVFSVRRGRSRSSIDTILEDLRAMHVPALGVILNCANHSDCDRYVSKSKVSRRALALDSGEMPEPEPNSLVRAIEEAAESGRR